MKEGILNRIIGDLGENDILSKLVNLPSTDLNSLLLEVFRQKSKQISPSELMQNYQNNRFVSPAEVDVMAFMEFELKLLKMAQKFGFTPLELSPVSPLGACSAVATVDQNKILSALRNTEVMADATNVLALECSKRRKEQKFDATKIKLCSIHRHLRTPAVSGRLSMAHFKIFCLVTSGKDTGSGNFEKASLLNHLTFYHEYLNSFKFFDKIKISLKSTQAENPLFEKLCKEIENKIEDVIFEKEEKFQQYYQTIQFKIFGILGEQEFELGDGGFVNWSKKLTNNNKERMLTSGLGIERLYKVLEGVT